MSVITDNKSKTALKFLMVAGLFLVLLPFFVSIRDVSGWEGNLFEALMTDRVRSSIYGSLLLAFSTGIAGGLIGVPAAYFLSRYELPFSKVWVVVFTLPLVMPSYISAYSYLAALGKMGFFEELFGFAFPIAMKETLFGSWLSMTMVNFPFVFLMTYAALLNLPASIEESALTLGFSKRQIFFKIIFPNIKVPVISGMLLIALYSLSDFGTPAIMNYRTLTFEIFKYWDIGRFSHSSLYALVLILLAFIILGAEGLINRNSHFQLKNKNCKPVRKERLSLKGTSAVLAFLFSIFSVSILLPVFNVLYWALQGREKFAVSNYLGPATYNSVVLALLTAGFALFFAFPFAWLAVREKGKLAYVADRVSFLGNMLPGVVIALALVSFFVSFRIGNFTIYHTLAMPVFGCAIRFLPQAVSSLKTSLVQINPSLEEAAVSLGKSPWQAFKSVTLPLIKPGTLAAFALVFITTIKELPITLMLSPPGKRYLTQNIWDFIDEAEYSRVAVPAMMLLIISSLTLFFTLKQNKRRVNAE
ncbi:MAG: iron ABC transporter permease [Lentisphaerales bacterium]|nr:iron ABC transporter permease [Lentisphaerales bacterium]